MPSQRGAKWLQRLPTDLLDSSNSDIFGRKLTEHDLNSVLDITGTSRSWASALQDAPHSTFMGCRTTSLNAYLAYTYDELRWSSSMWTGASADAVMCGSITPVALPDFEHNRWRVATLSFIWVAVVWKLSKEHLPSHLLGGAWRTDWAASSQTRIPYLTLPHLIKFCSNVLTLLCGISDLFINRSCRFSLTNSRFMLLVMLVHSRY